MDQALHSSEVYDFRKYDRIWQRVAPTLEPYPAGHEGKTAAGTSNRTDEDSLAPIQPAVRQESQLPGAVENPCCMGSAAADMLEVVTGFIEEELEERRQFFALAQQAPVWLKQKLRDMGTEEGEHARRLMAVYYLITGACYRPNIRCDRICIERWCPALRERYHAQACSGMNYLRAAEGTTDPCLRDLLEELGRAEYCHAERLLKMLELVLPR